MIVNVSREMLQLTVSLAEVTTQNHTSLLQFQIFHSRSKATRFLFVQLDGFNNADTWALGHLYIGRDCPGMCSGHGRCTEDGCMYVI